LIAAARRKVLLVDHSKFNRNALHELAPLTAFDVVVVDSGIGDDQLTAIRDLGVAVEIAEIDPRP
jgi:DeoR/GlpR family transcriptional regulator of sugar metabolism